MLGVGTTERDIILSLAADNNAENFLYKLKEEEGLAVTETVSEKVIEASQENRNIDLKSIKNRQDKLKFSYKEQKEYDTIDDDIAKLEEKIVSLDEDIIKNSRDFVKLGELTKEKEITEALLEEKMERWMYLQDLAEKIASQNK